MKKILLLLFILATQIAGCSKNSSFSEEEKAILNYDFLYNQTPGDSLSYNMIFECLPISSIAKHKILF